MKLNIRLFLNRNKVNASGKCPIRCRVTYRKQRKEFSTGLLILPKYWNSKKQKVLEDDVLSEYNNTQLSLIINKMNQAFLLLQVQESIFDVGDIYTLYKGENIKKECNTVEYFEVFLKSLKRLVNIDIKQITFNKYFYVKQHVKAFIKWKYDRNDFPLKDLKLKFLNDFEYYLKVEKGQKQITINKTLQRFRKPIKIAISEGYLDKDPFLLFKSKRVRSEIVFLDSQELEFFENFQFTQSRLQQVKDWFVFSCYTGLAYNELSRFSKKHISTGFDGQKWIIMKRMKTDKEIAVPILPKADKLIKKYSNEEKDTIFDLISNQRYNSYLKEMAILVGIDKRLTTHTARKTFASTVLLFNDVPMDIVSELLGHSSIKVTEKSYGKIVRIKVSDLSVHLYQQQLVGLT